MFVVTTTLTKSDPATRYWRIFNADHDALLAVCYASGELLSSSTTTNKDSRVIVQTWASDEAWLEYAEHPATIAISAERDAYEEEHEITKVVETALIED
jgi:heme-degrading monooxygenase HmoA